MSEDVHYKGKLTEVDCEDIDDFIRDQLKGVEPPKWYDFSNSEELREYFLYEYTEDRYLIANEVLYRVQKYELDPYGHFLANRNPDGSISFDVKYYNGGCGFTEAIEQALEEMENNG
jgi:hypothetical protein